MSGYTSVRLSRYTRDKLNDLADELGMTADRTIEFVIDEYVDEQWRAAAIEEMSRIKADPADQAEVRAAMRDMGERMDDEPGPNT